MFRLTMTQLLCVTLVLVGCNASNEPDPVANAGPFSSPPAQLRVVDSEQLVARVFINELSEAIYYGRDFPDGKWQIPVDLLPDQDNELTIRWFQNALLLLEESATFFWNSRDPVVRPTTTFKTNGDARFDDDCDGVSNLAELYANTNPSVANTPTATECEPAAAPNDIDLDGSTRARLTLNSQIFFQNNEFTERLTKFTVPVKTTEAAEGMFIKNVAQIFTETNNEGFQARIHLELNQNPAGQRTAALFTNEGSQGFASDIEGSVCAVGGARPTFVSCRLPFDWKDDHWYNLEIAEVGLTGTVGMTNWQGTIIDLETGVRSPLGTITIQTKSEWALARVFISYPIGPLHSDCRDGLDTSELRVKSGLLNDSYALNWAPLRTFTDCIKIGAGYNFSARMVDGELLHSVRLGRR